MIRTIIKNFASVFLLVLSILSMPLEAGPCVDFDGDGWGWDGSGSCRVAAPVCIDADNDGYGWDGSQSCIASTGPSSAHYTGVSDSMWNEIDLARMQFGDWNDCRARVEGIPGTGFQLSACNGNCINNALQNNSVVVLEAGRYRISETVVVSGKTLIGDPNKVVIDASDVDVALRVGNGGTLAGLAIHNARDVGVVLGDHSTLYELSVDSTGQNAHYNSNGAGVFAYNRQGNCIVSVESNNGYNEDGKSCAVCYNGGNADGYKISTGSGRNTFIDSHAAGNSDDGFDFWEAGSSNFIYFSSAFNNGKPANGRQAGDGNGFKLGIGSARHFIYKSSAHNNLRGGFDINGNTVSPLAVSSSAYNNHRDWVGIVRTN